MAEAAEAAAKPARARGQPVLSSFLYKKILLGFRTTLKNRFGKRCRSACQEKRQGNRSAKPVRRKTNEDEAKGTSQRSSSFAP